MINDEMVKHNNRYKLFLLLILLALIPLITFSPTYAAECGGAETSIISCETGKDGIWSVISLVTNIMSGLVGILAVIGIIIFGIQYITASGDQSKMTKAKRRLFEIVLGLAAYFLLYGLVQWLIPGGNIDVATVPIDGVVIDTSKTTVYLNSEKKLTAYVQPYNADDKSLTWSSSNSNVIAVNKNGEIEAKSTGTATITATAVNGMSASVTLSVIKEPVPEPKTDEGWSMTSSRSAYDPDESTSDFSELPEGTKLGYSSEDGVWKNGNECTGDVVYQGKKYDLDYDTMIDLAALVVKENCSSDKSEELDCKLLASQIINLYEEQNSEHSVAGLKNWLKTSTWWRSNVDPNKARSPSDAHQLAINVVKQVVMGGNRYLPLFVGHFDGAYHWVPTSSYCQSEDNKDSKTCEWGRTQNIFNSVPTQTYVKGTHRVFWCVEGGEGIYGEVFDYDPSYKKKLGM